jgi:hypothetical protein
MANCDVQSLVSEANCFNGLYDIRQIQLVNLALLCRILQTQDPMATCDVNTLMESAKCFDCLSEFQLAMLQAQLLCEIQAGGGTGGGSGVTCGVVNPVAAPTGTCGIYYRTDTGSIWLWDGAAWQQKIV